jgi:membrane-associated progesterone receptor component
MTLPYREHGWSLDEIAPFDGNYPDVPILFACKGRVYNVWRGEEFYGKNGPYKIFSGTDATRLLAKGVLVPETAEQAEKELSWFEKETLAGWIDIFVSKYDDIGPLQGYSLAEHGFDEEYKGK